MSVLARAPRVWRGPEPSLPPDRSRGLPRGTGQWDDSRWARLLLCFLPLGAVGSCQPPEASAEPPARAPLPPPHPYPLATCRRPVLCLPSPWAQSVLPAAPRPRAQASGRQASCAGVPPPARGRARAEGPSGAAMPTPCAPASQLRVVHVLPGPAGEREDRPVPRARRPRVPDAAARRRPRRPHRPPRAPPGRPGAALPQVLGVLAPVPGRAAGPSSCGGLAGPRRRL